MISNNINQSFQKDLFKIRNELSLKMSRTKEQIGWKCRGRRSKSAQDVFFPCSLFMSVSPFT